VIRRGNLNKIDLKIIIRHSIMSEEEDEETYKGSDEEEEDEDEEEDEEEEAEEEVEEDESSAMGDIEESSSDYIGEDFNRFENNKTYVNTYHPEEVHLSFDEMYNLSLVTRDDKGTIEDPLHKTYPILSKYEKAKLIGLRVGQLNRGAPPFINVNHMVLDKHLIAEEELKQKKIPFILKRPIPNGSFEYWHVKDLELI
jgi:DNA-directed RNA polymerase I, II, and III subunit RPABC2